MTKREADYELLEIIGKGSFGSVYKGFWKESGQIVAIKVIDLTDPNEIFEDLQQEIKTLSECHNDNIIRFYESFVSESQLYIIMEYLSGGSVMDILKIRNFL